MPGATALSLPPRLGRQGGHSPTGNRSASDLRRQRPDRRAPAPATKAPECRKGHTATVLRARGSDGLKCAPPGCRWSEILAHLRCPLERAARLSEYPHLYGQSA